VGPGIEFIFMIALGGAGNVWGAVVGASVITALKTVLQGILPRILGRAGNFEVIVFGILMIASLQWMRGGIWVFFERLLPPVKNPPIPEAKALIARTQPARGELLLKVESIRKEFGGLVAVNNVSCEVYAGEILGLIGPNGAGKTTMFNLISGELPRTSGNISFASQKISGLLPHQIARHGLIRTFQHVKLIANMTVIENVMLGAYLRTHDGLFAAGMPKSVPRRPSNFAAWDWQITCSLWPEACPWVNNELSRLPALSVPIQSCSCSMNRLPVCDISKNRNWQSYSRRCAMGV
jgi:branched-chain amino acid transport system permease protein